MEATRFISPPTNSLKQLEKRMEACSNYDDWLDVAQQHDLESGAEEWKGITTSSLYDYTEIQARYENLKACMENGADRELLYALNEGVHGNMGGMGKAILYHRARSGTKTLIDNYVNTIAKALKRIHDTPDDIISYAEKVDFFRRASHCYGRSALLLSGGAGLIYFHHGVVQELINEDLLPNVVSGASAGSIVAAQLGTIKNDALKADYFINKRFEEFNSNPMMDTFLGRLSEADSKESKERALDEAIPKDITFQEAFEETGRYINISISPAEKHQSSRLMNAITSPNVYIRSAVSASCSIPGLIPAERLYAKGMDGKPRNYLANRRWVDGSVSGDLPAKRLSRLYGVNHFIVSMINPVIIPFIEDVTTQQRSGFKNVIALSLIKMFNESLAVSERLFDRRGELGNRIASQIAYTIRMLEQNYLGDINILLRKKDFKWRHTVFDFKDGEIEQLINAGRRNTWPKMSMIKNAALISKTLDTILEDLNARGIQAPSGNKHHIYS